MIKPIKKIILILIAAVMALSMAPLASAAGESVPDTRNGKVAFSGAELQWIAGHGPLSVGWLSDSDPYIFTQDGETAGAAVLYIRKLAQLMSLEVSFEEYSDADGLVQALKSGKVDFAAAFFYSENEAEDLGLLLTNPYYNANFAVISSPDSSGGESSLTAYSAGCCRSYLDRALPGCTALTFPTDKACVDAVADGSVCRAVIESYSAQELLRRSQYGTLSFKLLGSAFPCRFASADPELVNVLNTAIDGLDASVISSEATNITVASVDKYRQSEMESSRVFYIAATDAMCFALILLVVIYFLVNSRFLTRTSRSFMGICLAAMLRFASDAVQSLANGREGSAALTLNQISILAVYISGPIMAFMVGMFLYDLVSERRRASRSIIWICLVYTAGTAAMLIINVSGGLLYYFSDVNVYYRGEASTAFFIFTGACIAAMGIWLMCMRKALSGKELTALLVAMSMPVAGSILQLYQPDISPADAFCTVGICAAFMSLQSILFKSERRGRINSQTELEGIAGMFTGVYRWNTDSGNMEGSVTDRDYAPLLSNGILNMDRLLSDAVCPADRAGMADFLSPQHLKELNAEPEKLTREFEYREIGVHDGEWRRVLLIHLPAGGGAESQLYMVFQDITYEKSLAEHSAAQRRRLVGAAAGLYTDICEWNMGSDTALRLTITPDGVREQALDTAWSENLRIFREEKVMPEDYALFDRVLPENIIDEPAGSAVETAFRVLTDGEYHWNSVAIKVFVEGNGARTAMYMQQDIESSIREHNAMRDKSEHDAMTDLFNRSKLDEMKKLEYGGLDTCGVLFFDINYLKRTNDTLGHDAGDELIRLASESIRSITNRHVMAYRIGGDEMLVVAANTSREDFEQMLELWSVRLEALNAASDIKCSMAVGSAWSSEPDIDALIRAADAQMYQHKKAMKAEREN